MCPLTRWWWLENRVTDTINAQVQKSSGSRRSQKVRQPSRRTAARNGNPIQDQKEVMTPAPRNPATFSHTTPWISLSLPPHSPPPPLCLSLSLALSPGGLDTPRPGPRPRSRPASTSFIAFALNKPNSPPPCRGGHPRPTLTHFLKDDWRMCWATGLTALTASVESTWKS
jgi:hypothetical protein